MRLLKGMDEEEARGYMQESANIALLSTCGRSRCGSVIVNGDIIGTGFNSPPRDINSQRRCLVEKSSYHGKVTDKTCCVHAEQRAIIDALRNNPRELEGSRLYFIRLDKKGAISFAGEPYCTICSKMALDVGIKEFSLWRPEGICVYDTDEYNSLSFQYNG